MFPFLETIQIKNNEIRQLEFHQKRVEKTFLSFYPNQKPWDLKTIIQLTENAETVLKCRILYNDSDFSIEFSAYQPTIHSQFKLIEVSDFNYDFKFSDRQFFQKTKQEHPNSELILTQNGKITDTTYANLIFLKEGKWFTPKSYLLNGTKRQFLLETETIQETEISLTNLSEYSHFKQINAMLDFEDSFLYPIERII